MEEVVDFVAKQLHGVDTRNEESLKTAAGEVVAEVTSEVSAELAGEVTAEMAAETAAETSR